MPTGFSSDDIKLPSRSSLEACCMKVWIFSCHAIKAVDNEQWFYMLKRLERNISGKPFIDWMFSVSFLSFADTLGVMLSYSFCLRSSFCFMHLSPLTTCFLAMTQER